MFSYQKNFIEPTMPVDEAQFFALVRASRWAEIIEKFRQTGEQALKRKLPAFIFQSTFDETLSKSGKLGRWRKQSATRLTGLVVMDVDHIEQPQSKYAEWISLDFAALGILLVYITPSGKGLKVVFKADVAKGNLIDNQHAMARILGVEVDEACKDASRMSFICKESDILYLDRELFTYENKAFAERYDEEYRGGRSGATLEVREVKVVKELSQMSQGNESALHEAQESNGLTTLTTPNSLTTEKSTENFKGRPYSDIISEWWKRQGGEPQEGERNVKLHQLAVNLRSICDNDKGLLLKIMPRLGLDEQEITRIVDSACKEPPKGISKSMREIVGMADLQRSEADMERQLWEWGAQIEALSNDFPLLKDITKGLRKNQYPAALFVAGGLMMTLMTRCTYRFYHRPEELRRLNNSTLIIGDPASGKSFATRLYKLLTAPIQEADQIGKDAINAYREQMKTKGANKEKPKKPKVIVRIHPARTSNAQFIQDMVNAVEVVDGKEMQLHTLTFDTELDNTLSLQRNGGYIDKQALELKAFHNEEDGQFYANMESVMENFSVTWNFIYTGTPLALKKKVNERNFGSGLVTRLTCIPLPTTNFEMLDWEENIDNESDERLKAWAYRLDKTKGELSLRKIVRELFEWTGRRMLDAKDDDSRANEMLLKRCAYHGLNFSAPFILMRHWDAMQQDGGYWCGKFDTDDMDWRLAELLVNIQYACQRHFFGAMAEKYFDDKVREAAVNVQHRQKTYEAFQRLSKEFGVEDVVRCFQLNSEATARKRIARLQKDHLVEKIGEVKVEGNHRARYRKTGISML